MQNHYQHIEKAIKYLNANFKQQPSLEDLSDEIALSPFHLQRVFQEWAGISPKKFIQFLSLQHAKSLLKQPGITLFEASYKTGLSGTGRLHDLFVTIERMTPGEYKKGGEGLTLKYGFYDSVFGRIRIVSTDKGICDVAFVEQDEKNDLMEKFPNARWVAEKRADHKRLLRFLNEGSTENIKLHLKGTEFQLKVWEALLKIPEGNVSTYGKIAAEIGNHSASRAVGTAIGSNNIAFIIPCHRVIQASGSLGGYRWGPVRKQAMLGREAARRDF